MATTFQSLYGASNQAITITLASLASAAARASTVIDNSVNLYLDALLQLTTKSGASGVSATGYISVYGYGSADGGTTYGEGITGTDANVTLTNPNNLPFITSFNMVAAATVYSIPALAIARAFGGILPQKWGIVVVNNSGHALDATEGNFAKFYQGYSQQAP